MLGILHQKYKGHSPNAVFVSRVFDRWRTAELDWLASMNAIPADLDEAAIFDSGLLDKTLLRGKLEAQCLILKVLVGTKTVVSLANRLAKITPGLLLRHHIRSNDMFSVEEGNIGEPHALGKFWDERVGDSEGGGCSEISV